MSPEQLIAVAKEMGTPSVVALFGSPYLLARVQDADAIVVGYEDAPEAHELVARTIAGKLNPQGVLPVTSGPFAIGQSLGCGHPEPQPKAKTD